jgi:hypothetical protein
LICGEETEKKACSEQERRAKAKSRIAITTIAAIMAIEKGITVISATKEIILLSIQLLLS